MSTKRYKHTLLCLCAPISSQLHSLCFLQMTEETYNDLHMYMDFQISRLNKDKSIAASDGMLSGDGTVVPVAETGNLFAEHELRFMHFRHWSLYDSM